jgi:hypothetical protein
MHRSLPALLAAALCAAACGTSSGDAPPGDGGLDAVVERPRPRDAMLPIDEEADAAKAPWERMTKHDAIVLANPKLLAVYIGDVGVDSARSFDDLMSWMVTSEYWKIMAQYGIHPGTMLPSVHVPTGEVFPPGSLSKGLIDADALDARLSALMVDANGGTGASDAGLDAHVSDGGAGDAGASDAPASDAGDDASIANDAGPPPRRLPKADGYIFFLPNGVNVSLPQPSGPAWQTCIEAGGYHTYSVAPYSVIPPCAFGRAAISISHEIAEMVTDPIPGSGWFSEDDLEPAGGEIGDLCNEPMNVEGWAVTRLWSNHDADCMPAPF